MTDIDVNAVVPACDLGEVGDIVPTPEVVSFTGAAITIWHERKNDPASFWIAHKLSAGGWIRRFQLDLRLADMAAWVVLAEAPITGPECSNEGHTVRLLRFNWNGTVEVVAVVTGYEFVDKLHGSVPQEVWDRLRNNQLWYSCND